MNVLKKIWAYAGWIVLRIWFLLKLLAQREPLLVRGVLVTAGLMLAHVLLTEGLIPSDWANKEAIGNIVDSVFALMGIGYVRAGVTPAANPTPAPDPEIDQVAPTLQPPSVSNWPTG